MRAVSFQDEVAVGSDIHHFAGDVESHQVVGLQLPLRLQLVVDFTADVRGAVGQGGIAEIAVHNLIQLGRIKSP